MAKQYRQSADAFNKAFQSMDGKGIPMDRYNAACVWTLAGNNDSAFNHLKQIATNINFIDYHSLFADPDLSGLHSDKRWTEFCEIVKQSKSGKETGLNKPLVDILDTIMQKDQEYRARIKDMEQKYGRGSSEVRMLWDTIRYYDSIDLIKVTAIIDKYGWPGPDMVGNGGNTAVFLVIQHADLITQDKYLPAMREAVKNKKAAAGSLALLEDRVALRHGKKQIYGSQVSTDNGGNFLAPLEDPDNVDKRRAEVGLGPISEYLQYFNVGWNAVEYKKQLPVIEKREKALHQPE